MSVTPKGLEELVAEDGTLSQPITYQEYESGAVGRAGNRTDTSIESAYEEYRRVMNRLQHKR